MEGDGELHLTIAGGRRGPVHRTGQLTTTVPVSLGQENTAGTVDPAPGADAEPSRSHARITQGGTPALHRRWLRRPVPASGGPWPGNTQDGGDELVG